MIFRLRLFLRKKFCIHKNRGMGILKNDPLINAHYMCFRCKKLLDPYFDIDINKKSKNIVVAWKL